MVTAAPPRTRRRAGRRRARLLLGRRLGDQRTALVGPGVLLGVPVQRHELAAAVVLDTVEAGLQTRVTGQGRRGGPALAGAQRGDLDARQTGQVQALGGGAAAQGRVARGVLAGPQQQVVDELGEGHAQGQVGAGQVEADDELAREVVGDGHHGAFSDGRQHPRPLRDLQGAGGLDGQVPQRHPLEHRVAVVPALEGGVLDGGGGREGTQTLGGVHVDRRQVQGPDRTAAIEDHQVDGPARQAPGSWGAAAYLEARQGGEDPLQVAVARSDQLDPGRPQLWHQAPGAVVVGQRVVVVGEPGLDRGGLQRLQAEALDPLGLRSEHGVAGTQALAVGPDLQAGLLVVFGVGGEAHGHLEPGREPLAGHRAHLEHRQVPTRGAHDQSAGHRVIREHHRALSAGLDRGDGGCEVRPSGTDLDLCQPPLQVAGARLREEADLLTGDHQATPQRPGLLHGGVEASGCPHRARGVDHGHDRRLLVDRVLLDDLGEVDQGPHDDGGGRELEQQGEPLPPAGIPSPAELLPPQGQGGQHDPHRPGADQVEQHQPRRGSGEHLQRRVLAEQSGHRRIPWRRKWWSSSSDRSVGAPVTVWTSRTSMRRHQPASSWLCWWTCSRMRPTSSGLTP